MTDEFDEFDVATPASSYPKLEQLQGRLVLVKVTELEKDVPSATFKENGRPTVGDRLTVNLKVVDGPLSDFDTTEFDGMWISQSYMVRQLKPSFQRGKAYLGRIDLKDPKKMKGQGNPWGFEEVTAEDVQTARMYLAGVKLGQTDSAAPAEDNPFKK